MPRHSPTTAQVAPVIILTTSFCHSVRARMERPEAKELEGHCSRVGVYFVGRTWGQNDVARSVGATSSVTYFRHFDHIGERLHASG